MRRFRKEDFFVKEKDFNPLTREGQDKTQEARELVLTAQPPTTLPRVVLWERDLRSISLNKDLSMQLTNRPGDASFARIKRTWQLNAL